MTKRQINARFSQIQSLLSRAMFYQALGWPDVFVLISRAEDMLEQLRDDIDRERVK